ncbi:sialin-like [Antedon mediterranea]|uniref:sialin-like n=1 Tax=Antedon mediterranea TaxID=105859 RepID=UPI003AF6927A
MKRYIVASMCCLAGICILSLRINLSFAIIEMVRRENLTEYQNLTDNMRSNHKTDELVTEIHRYDWNERQKQTVLAAFYYGYAVTSIPGGWLARQIGGKRSMVGVLLCSGLLTALIPWAAGFNYYLLLCIRILDGCVQGVYYPALCELLENWIIPHERSKLMSIAFSALPLSVAFCNKMSSWICDVGGWQYTFYILSVFSVFIAMIWMLFIYENPNKDPYISNTEREYINSFETLEENTPIAWFKIFTSSAVWALVIAYWAFIFILVLLLTECPIFINVILGFDLKTTGLLTSLPGLLQLLVVQTSGICADFIIQRKYLTLVNTRKLFTFLTLGISSLCLICIGVFEESSGASVVFLTVAFSSLGFYTSSVIPNIMEISKGHSGVIAGIMTSLAGPGCFIGPMMLGAFTVDNNTFKQWSWMFNITAGIGLIGMFTFLLFGSATEQKRSDENLAKHETKSYKAIEE